MDISCGLPSGTIRVLRGVAAKLEWGGMASRTLSWSRGGRAKDMCAGSEKDEGACVGGAVKWGCSGELSSHVHESGSTYA